MLQRTMRMVGWYCLPQAKAATQWRTGIWGWRRAALIFDEITAAFPIATGLSMFLLGLLLNLEAAQHFSPGRSVELGDVIAKGVGVSCGALLGLLFRKLIAIL